MPLPRTRRIAKAVAALALAFLASATLALPAHARASDAAVTGPADGAVVGTVVAFTTSDADSGYRLRWGTDPAVDSGGQLVNARGDVEVRQSEFSLIGLEAGTYVWQVTALDAGHWSEPRSFTVDPDADGPQLDTYPLPESPALPPSPVAGVDGRLWIVASLGFSIVLLVAVFFSARRAVRNAA